MNENKWGLSFDVSEDVHLEHKWKDKQKAKDYNHEYYEKHKADKWGVGKGLKSGWGNFVNDAKGVISNIDKNNRNRERRRLMVDADNYVDSVKNKSLKSEWDSFSEELKKNSKKLAKKAQKTAQKGISEVTKTVLSGVADGAKAFVKTLSENSKSHYSTNDSGSKDYEVYTTADGKLSIKKKKK